LEGLTMSTATDYERLLAGLDTLRWDWDYLRIVADSAEEAGDPKLAAGWRWLAGNRKWPQEWPPDQRSDVAFLWRSHRGERLADPTLLPPAVLKRLAPNFRWSGKGHLAVYRRSLHEALEAATSASGALPATRKR
jgi:hypothetical protein